METEHDTKERIHALLLQEPGVSTTHLARALDLDPSTVDHHLRKMRRASRVLSSPVGREMCWFAARSGLCPVLLRAIPALRRPGVAALARSLDEFPQTAPSLAQRSGVDVEQVRWAGSVLVGYGLAQRSSQGFLRLAPGAGVCIARAAAGERCAEWGKCAPSKAWRAEESGR